MTSPRRTISDESGFTLLEALVALVILSLATLGVGLAFPGLQQRTELRKATARLDELLIKARAEAQSGAGSAVLRFDAATRTLELSPSEIAYRLPRGVELAIIGGAFGDAVENPAIAFLSDGSSTGGMVELRAGAFSAARRVSWLTGRIDKEISR